MITINLLPKERKKTAMAWIFSLSVILVTLIIVGLSVATSLVLNIYVHGLNTQLTEIDQELVNHAEVLAKSEQLQADKKVLDEKKTIIDALVKNRIQWGLKLYELAQLIPEKVWLEKVELISEYKNVTIQPPKNTSSRRQQKAKKIQVRTDYLHIYAVTNKLEEKSSFIGDFIARIQKSETFFSDFESVDFQEGEEQPWDDQEKNSPLVWRFELKLKLRDHSPNLSSGDSEKNETA